MEETWLQPLFSMFYSCGEKQSQEPSLCNFLTKASDVSYDIKSTKVMCLFLPQRSTVV